MTDTGYTLPPETSGGGYHCACGQWVHPGWFHACTQVEPEAMNLYRIGNALERIAASLERMEARNED